MMIVRKRKVIPYETNEAGKITKPSHQHDISQ